FRAGGGIQPAELSARALRNPRHDARPRRRRLPGRASPPFRTLSARGETFMFCPRCGQQQASEEVRFCSRCGLRLDELAEFVEGGGRLAGRDPAEDLPALTPRQRRTRKGTMAVAAGLLLGLIALILTEVKQDLFGLPIL